MLPKGVCFKGEVSNVLVPSNCNLFTHGALRSSWELVEPCPCVLDPEPELFCACLTRAFPNPEALGSRMVPDWIGKTSRSKSENRQQTQPTYGVDARIRTLATLVGGECSLITAPSLAPQQFHLSLFSTSELFSTAHEQRTRRAHRAEAPMIGTLFPWLGRGSATFPHQQLNRQQLICLNSLYWK